MRFFLACKSCGAYNLFVTLAHKSALGGGPVSLPSPRLAGGRGCVHSPVRVSDRLAQLGGKDEGLCKSTGREDWRKGAGHLGESPPVFNRTLRACSPPYRLLSAQGRRRESRKDDLQITAAPLWHSVVGTEQFRARKGSREENPPPTPPSSPTLCHS